MAAEKNTRTYQFSMISGWLGSSFVGQKPRKVNTKIKTNKPSQNTVWKVFEEWPNTSMRVSKIANIINKKVPTPTPKTNPINK